MEKVLMETHPEYKKLYESHGYTVLDEAGMRAYIKKFLEDRGVAVGLVNEGCRIAYRESSKLGRFRWLLSYRSKPSTKRVVGELLRTVYLDAELKIYTEGKTTYSKYTYERLIGNDVVYEDWRVKKNLETLESAFAAKSSQQKIEEQWLGPLLPPPPAPIKVRRLVA
jgi:hypothetical protein